MTQATKDIVVDLWPLYISGEASADTRALVEAFLKTNPQLESGLREEEGAGLKPVTVALPADHERATLLRTQQRRARQSMLINASALFVSGALTAYFAWGMVPRLAATFATLRLPPPTAVQLGINASTWLVRLIPLGILGLIGAFLSRRRLSLPRFVESGTLVALATGIILVVAQLGWLVLLNDVSMALVEAHRALTSVRP